MNNFERRLFLEYFEKFFSLINFNNYYTAKFIADFFEEFKIKSKYDCSKLNINREMNFDERVKFKNFLKETLIQLKNKIKPTNTLFENKTLAIKEIFQLEESEYKFMLYKLFEKDLQLIGSLFSVIETNSSEFSKSLYGLLGLKYEYQVENTRNNLIQKGVATKEYRYGRMPELSTKIIEILENKSIKTEKQICKFLLGKEEKSNLKISDYKYLKNELNKTVEIVKSAVACKAKGINILLYGSVGCGKTEFAKLIANNATIPIYSVKTETDYLQELTREGRLSDLRVKQRLLSNSKNSCILFDEAEDVMNTGFSFFDRSASKGYLNKILETTPVPVIWTTNNIYDVDPAFLRRMTYSVEFEKLTDKAKFNIWNKTLKKNDLKLKNQKLKN